jgi:hypothetical protein
VHLALKVTEVDPDQAVIGGYLLPAPLVEKNKGATPEEVKEQVISYLEHQ